MEKKLKAGVIGATGMVGQVFVSMLENHPMFELTALAASPSSAGKTYKEAVSGRWKINAEFPAEFGDIMVYDASDIKRIAPLVDFVFCAVEMSKEDTRALEEAYARAEVPVVSNNSACRGLDDVPMLIPEINATHLAVIETQKARLGTKNGFIAVAPNCSIQSYVPMLTPLLDFGIKHVAVSTYQAISGAGKSFADWPEMSDNVIPFINGEEEKSSVEPLKIWGSAESGKIVNAASPAITAQCIRVPVSNGHLASVFVKFDKKPTAAEIIKRWNEFSARPQELKLPNAPKQVIHYFDAPDRPQTGLDRDLEGGMAFTAGRLREDEVFDYKFVGLSHNTIRGAAGGAVLIAELLAAEGFIG